MFEVDVRMNNELEKSLEESRKNISLSLERKKLSEEHRKKIGLANSKRIVTEETRKKMSLAGKGKIISEETRKKIGLANNKKIKRICLNCRDIFFAKASEVKKGFGKFHSKKCYSEAMKTTIKGRKHTEETKRKMSEAKKGEDGSNWRGGITPITKTIRQSFEYKRWRQGVFVRDNFTCQKCKECGGKLRAHHKKAFSILIQEAKNYMSLFNLYTACMYYAPLWDINNGVTLCEDCHKKTKHLWK